MIDVRKEIAAAPLGRHHFLIGSLIALIVFFDGYDTFNAAYVIHYVMKPWHLLEGQAGLLVSSGMFGFLGLRSFCFLLFGLFTGFFAFFLSFRLVFCQFPDFVFVVFAFELGDEAAEDAAVGLR